MLSEQADEDEKEKERTRNVESRALARGVK